MRASSVRSQPDPVGKLAVRPSSAAKARVQRQWGLVERARETSRRLRRASPPAV